MSEKSKESPVGAGPSASGARKASGVKEHASFFENDVWTSYEKGFKKFQQDSAIPKVDFDMLLGCHHKNIETIRQAQQAASELMQGIATLNNQYIRSSFDDVGSHVKAFSGAGPEPLNPKVSASSVKSAFDRSMAHCKQVTDLFSQSTSKMFECYRRRFEEGLQEAQALMQKASAP